MQFPTTERESEPAQNSLELAMQSSRSVNGSALSNSQSSPQQGVNNDPKELDVETLLNNHFNFVARPIAMTTERDVYTKSSEIASRSSTPPRSVASTHSTMPESADVLRLKKIQEDFFNSRNAYSGDFQADQLDSLATAVSLCGLDGESEERLRRVQEYLQEQCQNQPENILLFSEFLAFRHSGQLPYGVSAIDRFFMAQKNPFT